MATKKIKERKIGSTLTNTLTNQQQMFIKLLLADPKFDLCNAARLSGYANPAVAGNRLLKNKIISATVGKAIRDRSERLEFTADDVLARLRVVLDVDLTDIYDKNGHVTMKDIKDLPAHIRKCITKIKTYKNSTIDEDGETQVETKYEIEWMSKDAALQLAMRHFGLLQPDININVINPEIKARVLIELLQGTQNANSGVIDGSVISSLASKPIDSTN